MSLYRNINRRKKAGTSRSKKKSTISAKAYANMKAGFPNSKKNKAKRKRKSKKIKEKDMPYGKGTYGSKRGRPPKKESYEKDGY